MLHNQEYEVDQLVAQIRREVADIQDKTTRDLWLDALQTFAASGDVESILAITKYRRKVVPIDEFMFSEAYMGFTEDQLYPAVWEAIQELDTGKYAEAVLGGGIGTGKSSIANYMIMRDIYKLSCMRSPQQTLGVQKRSGIAFTIQSVRLSTARKAVFDELGAILRKSPYFSNVYKYDPMVKSEILFPEQNVRLLPVSSSGTGAISMNVLGGILDECNFLQKIEKSKSGEADADGTYDQAKVIYDILSRRRRSRFGGRNHLPGTLFIVSSARFPDDFTEIKAAESTMCGGNDSTIYVYRKSLWACKRPGTYLEETFRVEVGDERFRSRILEEGEEPRPGLQVIDVPMDFRPEFMKDIDGSIRDYAGICTLTTKPFFSNRDAIHMSCQLAEECGYENIFNQWDADLSLGIPNPVDERIRLDVEKARFVHIDLAVNHDCAGLAIGHVAGARAVQKIDNETGVSTREVLPVIAFDAVMRIVPPPHGEIDFGSIRLLITRLRDKYKLPIRMVTTDGFNSTDLRQIMRKLGFATDYVSVDRTMDAYRSLRDGIYDGRILIPRHPTLVKELSNVEYTRKGQHEKIDHRPGLSKDCSDAVAGVVASILKQRSTWSGNHTLPDGAMLLYGGKKRVSSSVVITEDQTPPSGRGRTNRKSVIRKRSVRRGNAGS